MTGNRRPYGMLAGIVAALCWTLADMLLVGFVPRPEAYPLFSQTLAGRLDTPLAVLMLEASPQRLYWGIYLATFSVVLYILAMPSLRRLLPSGYPGSAAALLLLLGYATSPLGHAAFGYLGLQAQSMLAADSAALEAQVVAFNQFKHLLDVHWLLSVSASALGWLGVLWLVLGGRTPLPRWTAVSNPLLLAPAIGLACAQFPDSLPAAMLGGACLNIAQLGFFAVTLALLSRHPH